MIGYFDPSSAEAARKAKQSNAPSALAATAQRTVDDSLLKGKKLVKEEEDYFVGSTKKKGKKGRKGVAASTEEKAEEAPAKLSLNVGLFEQLSTIGVTAPSSQTDVPKTLEEIRKKLQWYKDNQDRVTKEVCLHSKPHKHDSNAESFRRTLPRPRRSLRSLRRRPRSPRLIPRRLKRPRRSLLLRRSQRRRRRRRLPLLRKRRSNHRAMILVDVAKF